MNFPRLPYRNWTIFGIDLSLSRTGFAVLHCDDGEAQWGAIGSLAPRDSKQETWARATALGIALRERISEAQMARPGSALVVSMEFPDPNNSYLMGLNQVIQTILWTADDQGGLAGGDKVIYRLAINAATLRATLRLTGGTDKGDNLEMAYHYVPKEHYPNLDSDSCDAALLAMMGKHASMVFMSKEALVPAKPQVTLCSMEMKEKTRTDRKTGEKIVIKETPRGLLHNPATWMKIESPTTIVLGVSDARHPGKSKRAVNTNYCL